MKIELEKHQQAFERDHEDEEIKSGYSAPEKSNGSTEFESGEQPEDEEYIFEIDPEILVASGLDELFEWMKETRGVVISKQKRDVTVECYSLTLQQLLKKKKLKPWQGSLIMTAVIGVDFMRQTRKNGEAEGGKNEQ